MTPDSQTLNLQREALRRVREMQQRARESVAQTNSAAPPAFSGKPNMPPVPPVSNPAMRGPPQRPAQGFAAGGPNFAAGAQRGGGSILSHLMGGGRQRPNQGGSKAGAAAGVPSGILDLLRRQGVGDKVGSLGETLQSTISSVSQPAADLLESFGIDGEKLIILLIMWAVFNEHQDNKTLLIALGYLLL